MPFVQGKCENCGGILVVDPDQKAANCPFCGVAYVVQDSINYYNTTINVGTMHAEVVNVSDESTSEGRLKAAAAFMKLEQYNDAENEYRTVTKLTPQNHLGWLGIIEARTHNYTRRIKSAGEIDILRKLTVPVIKLAPAGTGKQLIRKFEEYISNEEKKNADDRVQFDKDLKQYKSQTAPVLDKILVQRGNLTNSMTQNAQAISSFESLANQTRNIKKNYAGNWFVGIALTIVSIIIMRYFHEDPPVGLVIGGIVLIPGILIMLVPIFARIGKAAKISSYENKAERLKAKQKKLQEQYQKLEEQRNSLPLPPRFDFNEYR